MSDERIIRLKTNLEAEAIRSRAAPVAAHLRQDYRAQMEALRDLPYVTVEASADTDGRWTVLALGAMLAIELVALGIIGWLVFHMGAATCR